jgi:hypothetical protein
MKRNKNRCARGCYWLIGNTIDGVCCHPRRQRMTERDLIAYLSTQFLIDFNASRGEFDFTIYLDRPGFRVRQLYGYYLQGPKKDVLASVDYMTADSITRVVRRDKTFRFYRRPGLSHGRPVGCITLP